MRLYVALCTSLYYYSEWTLCGKLAHSEAFSSVPTESRAIVRYICDKYPNQGPNLHGSTLFDKAQVEQWLEVESQTFTPVVRILILHLLVGPTLSVDATDSESVVAEYTEKLASILDVYEARLSRSKYLAGDFLSIADLSHVPTGYYYFNHAKQMEMLSSRKHVAAWWEDISNRPSWKIVVENAGPSFDKWYRPRCTTT